MKSKSKANSWFLVKSGSEGRCASCGWKYRVGEMVFFCAEHALAIHQRHGKDGRSKADIVQRQIENGYPSDWKPLLSRFASVCIKCNKHMPKGSEIWFDFANKKSKHRRCP